MMTITGVDFQGGRRRRRGFLARIEENHSAAVVVEGACHESGSCHGILRYHSQS